MRLRGRLGIDRRRQRQFATLMELGLVGTFFIGLERGDTGIIVNAGVALLVVQLPPILERDFRIPLNPALVLWITAAVFFHAVGTAGLPGSTTNFYRSIWWWDHVTHALSSSVVAAVGYTTARAFDVHSENVTFPPRFVFVFIMAFVLAFGVLWEVIEFAVSGAAILLGTETMLTQYGLEDTMFDLVFDTVGAVVVGAWGTVYLSDVVDAVARRLGGPSA